jgi:uncharacterized protein
MVKQKTALITGASSGIGYELAQILAADHVHLVLTARSQDKLEQMKEELEREYTISVHVIPIDLSIPEAPAAIVRELERRGLVIDILVNSAGFGLNGAFAETEWSEEAGMIQLNIIALTELCKRLMKGMIERGDGKILNVASTAAFQPGPFMAVYYATKAYVLSFSEALANELKGTGVTVTALCPGPTETGFGQRAQMEGTLLFKRGVMDAKTVARAGYDGLKKGKTVVIPGVKNALLAQLVRLMPRNAVTNIVRMLQERK